jgi:hypothetical protein
MPPSAPPWGLAAGTEAGEKRGDRTRSAPFLV